MVVAVEETLLMAVSMAAGERIPAAKRSTARMETRIRGFLITSRAIFLGSGRRPWLWTSRQMTAQALKRGATTVEAMAMMLMSWPGYMEVARPIPSTTKLERKMP